jgi:hypothetical protein
MGQWCEPKGNLYEMEREGSRTGLEVSAKQSGDGAVQAALGVRGVLAVQPSQECVDVELVVPDGLVHSDGHGVDLREVAQGEARAAGPADDVVRGVLVGVGGGLALRADDLEHGVDAEAGVRPDGRADAVDERSGEVCRVDSAVEELGGVVADGLVVDHCTKS